MAYLIHGFLLLLSAIGLFLSLWILIPAPVFALLPLSVGAPEVSPWLMALNAIALLFLFQGNRYPLRRVAIAASVIGLAISAWPLLQWPATQQQIEAQVASVIPSAELAQVPRSLQKQWRSHPFSLSTVFFGIPTPEVRQDTIQFAAPDQVPLSLEVYRPSQVGQYPTLVVIYGGAWRSGTPKQDAEFNRYIAKQGYSVVAIDYRHAPQYQFPTQLEDVRTAIAYIQNNAQKLEVDVNRMAVLGRSAGAHLAMLAAYPPDSPPFRAVINYYGPVDLTLGYNDPPVPDPIDTRAVLRAFLGSTPQEQAERYRVASPYTYAEGRLPPSLLIYGKRDHIVKSVFGRRLYEKLQATGNSAILIEIPWAEHAFDAVFQGVSNQIALYYTERFLAWALSSS
ncbi:MAG: alpha/beta hydrolase [Oculatellaceae cyanobacterium Prado106]|nr:alpha/beta hydrolase [Oculatellaceae cyanobacterium Prado106]